MACTYIWIKRGYSITALKFKISAIQVSSLHTLCDLPIVKYDPRVIMDYWPPSFEMEVDIFMSQIQNDE